VAPRLAALTVVIAAALAFVAGAAAALSLTLGTAPSFNVTLDGTDQAPAFNFTMQVSGAANAGWNITASATSFTAGAHTLNAPTVTSVALTSCTGGSCTPTNSITWPVALTGAAQKIYNAAAGTGKGTVNLQANCTMSVPGNAFAGSYASTLTLTIATGP
jgi:WxL domain surface cell wall-binding